jgi:hypothetical protein
MLRAMIGGARSPKALAQLAKGRMGAKISLLEQALDGRFSDCHALLAAKMLDSIEALDADIAELDAEVRRASEPTTTRSPGTLRSTASACAAPK